MTLSLKICSRLMSTSTKREYAALGFLRFFHSIITFQFFLVLLIPLIKYTTIILLISLQALIRGANGVSESFLPCIEDPSGFFLLIDLLCSVKIPSCFVLFLYLRC